MGSLKKVLLGAIEQKHYIILHLCLRVGENLQHFHHYSTRDRIVARSRRVGQSVEMAVDKDGMRGGSGLRANPRNNIRDLVVAVGE